MNSVHLRVLFCSFVFCRLLSGCAVGDPIPPTRNVQSLIDNVLETPLPSKRNQVIERLGPPQKRELTTVSNPHLVDVQDTVYVLHYRGLRIQIYHATYNDRQFLQSVKLSTPRWKPAGGIRLGMTKTRVEKILGSPARVTGGTWTYVSGEAESRVHLTFSDQRLQSLAWDRYVD